LAFGRFAAVNAVFVMETPASDAPSKFTSAKLVVLVIVAP
jgi:hypothetical protein